jgi:hypothetical protein
VIQRLGELGDLGQGRVPVGGNYRDAAIQRLQMLQHLPSIESA